MNLILLPIMIVMFLIINSSFLPKKGNKKFKKRPHLPCKYFLLAKHSVHSVFPINNLHKTRSNIHTHLRSESAILWHLHEVFPLADISHGIILKNYHRATCCDWQISFLGITSFLATCICPNQRKNSQMFQKKFTNNPW